MRRHHWIMAAAALLFIAGWLVWNMFLVEADLGSGSPPAAATAPGD